MSTPRSFETTVDYYDRNAASFANGTLGVDMSHLYAEFLPRVPKGGVILDAGCGSGRDAASFKQQGFTVVAFDGSCELAALASKALGQSVLVMTFQDLESVEEYDAIWACASLLHVPTAEMDDVLGRLTRALRPGGILYASFKYGGTECDRNGRFFNDYHEAKFEVQLAAHPALALTKAWQTRDARPNRQTELWFNAILTRRMNTVTRGSFVSDPATRSGQGSR